MKKLLVLSIVLAGALVSCGTTGSVSLKTSQDSLSYAVGSYLGGAIPQMGFSAEEIDMPTVMKAIEAASTEKGLFTPDQVNEILTNYFRNIKPGKVKAASEKFITDAVANGATQTASGLAYKIETPGDETFKPVLGDTISVNYTGTLPDGKEFDSNKASGIPITFPLVEGGLIQGWIEGMQLVGKGGKITLFVPSTLAYGEQGASQAIGPNQALQFEIELVDVKKSSTK